MPSIELKGWHLFCSLDHRKALEWSCVRASQQSIAGLDKRGEGENLPVSRHEEDVRQKLSPFQHCPGYRTPRTTRSMLKLTPAEDGLALNDMLIRACAGPDNVRMLTTERIVCYGTAHAPHKQQRTEHSFRQKKRHPDALCPADLVPSRAPWIASRHLRPATGDRLFANVPGSIDASNPVCGRLSPLRGLSAMGAHPHR